MSKDFNNWNIVKQTLDGEHKPPFFKEREIWWCSIGVNIGFEVYGKGDIYSRPVLILKKLSASTFIGLPMTSKRKDVPFRHPINFKGQNGALLLDQMRIMDCKRLSKIMGTIGAKRFENIRKAVKDMI